MLFRSVSQSRYVRKNKASYSNGRLYDEGEKRRLAIDIIIPKIRPINPLMCIKAVSEIAKAVAHSPKGKALRRNRFLLNILKSYGIIGGPDENLFLSIEDASNADLAKTPFSVCCKQDNIQKIMAQFVNEDLANEYILQLAKKEAKDNSPPEKYFVSTMYAWQPARF